MGQIKTVRFMVDSIVGSEFIKEKNIIVEGVTAKYTAHNITLKIEINHNLNVVFYAQYDYVTVDDFSRFFYCNNKNTENAMRDAFMVGWR
jgi:hypothetical protein